MSAIILSIGKVRVQGPDSVRCRHSNGTREEALEKVTILMAWRLEGWSLRRERETHTNPHTHTKRELLGKVVIVATFVVGINSSSLYLQTCEPPRKGKFEEVKKGGFTFMNGPPRSCSQDPHSAA